MHSQRLPQHLQVIVKAIISDLLYIILHPMLAPTLLHDHLQLIFHILQILIPVLYKHFETFKLLQLRLCYFNINQVIERIPKTFGQFLQVLFPITHLRLIIKEFPYFNLFLYKSSECSTLYEMLVFSQFL